MPEKKCCTQLWLPDRCTIQQDSSTPDNNQPDYSGSPLAQKVHCRIRTIQGDETYRGRQVQGDLTHVVEMRYRAGVVNDMRILVTTGIYKNRLLNIVSVRPLQMPGKPNLLELYCSEITNG